MIVRRHCLLGWNIQSICKIGYRIRKPAAVSFRPFAWDLPSKDLHIHLYLLKLGKSGQETRFCMFTIQLDNLTSGKCHSFLTMAFKNEHKTFLENNWNEDSSFRECLLGTCNKRSPGPKSRDASSWYVQRHVVNTFRGTIADFIVFCHPVIYCKTMLAIRKHQWTKF